MSTIQGYKIKKELKCVGGCYANNYGVNAYLLEDGDVFLQAIKLGRKIPDHHAKMSFDYFEQRFRDDNKSGYTLVLDALEFLDPEFPE